MDNYKYKYKNLIYVGLITASFNLQAADFLNVPVDIKDIANAEEINGITFSTDSIKSSGTDRSVIDGDLITYLKMDTYQEYSYEDGLRPYTGSVNEVNKFDYAKTTKIDGVSLTNDSKEGNALQFSTSTMTLNHHSRTIQEIRNTGLSYSMWVKIPDVTEDSTMVSSGNYAKGNFNFGISNSKLKFNHRSDGKDQISSLTVSGTTPLQDGTWHHVAFAYDPQNNESRIYLDGNLDGSIVDTSPIGYKTNTFNTIIGASNNTKYGQFKGIIDELKIFKSALSDKIVNNFYNDTNLSGSIVYRSLTLPESSKDDDSYNTVKARINDVNGSAKVYVYQNDKWHRLIRNKSQIFNMAKREPITSLKYKIVLPYEEEVKSLSFDVSNVSYFADDDKFSFLFMGDDNGFHGSKVITKAYGDYDDLAMVFSIPDNGYGSGLALNHKRYKASWVNNSDESRYTPVFSGLGNHDVEYQMDVDYASKDLGINVSTSLPGMTNYNPGPYDEYENGYKDENLNYSFDYKNTHFIMVNGYFRDKDVGDKHNRFNEDGYTPFSHVSEDMLTWVEESLSSSTATHKFVFFHEGAFPPPGQRHETDSLDNGKAPNNSGPNNTRPMRDRLWTLLAKHNVTATMMGHNHVASKTWVADPSGQYNAVYEIEPGYIHTSKNYAVVTINDDRVEINSMTTSTNEYDYHSRSIAVIDRTASGLSPVTLEQYNAVYSSGYQLHEKTDYNLEVGSSIDNYSDYYFEARDDDINDQITFSVSGLPSFLKTNETFTPTGINQFRRINLVTSRDIKEFDVGTYVVTVTATDGSSSASKTININVSNKSAPQILSSNVAENAVLSQTRNIMFECKDNTNVSTGRIYELMTVTYNGVEVRQNGNTDVNHGGWRPMANVDSENKMYTGIQFKDKNVPVGDYNIKALCSDGVASSSPYVLNFSVVEGEDPSTSNPWIDAVFPVEGTSNPFKTINIWANTDNANSSSTARESASTIEVTDSSGKPVDFTVINEGDDPYAKLPGNIQVVFNEKLEVGTYNFKVTAKSSDEDIGETKFISYNVIAEPIVVIPAPKSPTDIWFSENLKNSNIVFGLNYNIVNGKVRLSWNSIIPAKGFYVYRNNILIDIVYSNQFIDELYDETKNYQYSVTAIDENNIKTNPSEVITLESTKGDDVIVSSVNYYIDQSITDICNTYNVLTGSCGDGDQVAYSNLTDVNALAKAGDTIILRQGYYNEMIKPENSGISGNPITFKSFDGELVVIEQTNGAALSRLPTGENGDFAYEKLGIYIWEKEYITVENITFNSLSGWGRIVNSNNIILKGNRFTDAYTLGSRASISFVNSHFNQVVDNSIVGGHDNVFFLSSNYNVLSGNDIRSGRHTLWTIKGGNYNIVKNNYFYNDLEKIGEIFDSNDVTNGEDEHEFNLTGVNNAKFNVVEGNQFAFTPSSRTSVYNGIQYAGQNGIIRDNSFYENYGGGFAFTTYNDEAMFNTNNRLYNNVFYRNHFSGMTITNTKTYDFYDNVVKNNIFYNNNFEDHQERFLSWADLNNEFVQIINGRTDGVLFTGNNVFGDRLDSETSIATIFNNDETPRARVSSSLSQTEADNSNVFIENLEVVPTFLNPENGDFRLVAGDLLSESGLFLTFARSSGDGDVIEVEDAQYFHNGFGIIEGDTIQLEDTGDRYKILDVDYINNRITIDSNGFWSENEGISLEYNGNRPEIGLRDKE